MTTIEGRIERTTQNADGSMICYARAADGREVRILASGASSGAAGVRAGDTISATGEWDTEGYFNAQSIQKSGATPGTQPRNWKLWLWLGLAVVVLIAAWLFFKTKQNMTVEDNTDRFGGDYAAIPMEQLNPKECAATCYADARCLAYTYVKPGTPGFPPAKATCMLKSVAPPPTSKTCCVSGIRK